MTAAAKLAPATRDTTLPFLAPLGIYGLTALEPIILAALVSADPMLLIGKHGTGKSYMLIRLARALGLTWRHYNASLIQFDDLAGYPLPNGKGGLDYVHTPATVWDIEAVFFDEIARCRPDMQNKLFPIIHEKRLQGIDLTKLKYRWSAMNPPPAEDEDKDHTYHGCEPLDLALADRFSFIIDMPAWESFSGDEQELIIRAKDDPIDEAAARRLRKHIKTAQEKLSLLEADLALELSGYVRLLVGLLRKAEIDVSPRRAAMLQRNILAVHICRLLQQPTATLCDSAILAAQNSLPHAAYGAKLSPMKVMGAHNEAWKLAQLKPDDPRRWLMLEPDPIKRCLQGAKLNLPTGDYSAIVADALAELPAGGRHALAAALFEHNLSGKLLAAIAEQAGTLYALVVSPPELSETVPTLGLRNQVYQHAHSLIARLDQTDPDTRSAANLLMGLFATQHLQSASEAERVLSAWQRSRRHIKEWL